MEQPVWDTFVLIIWKSISGKFVSSMSEMKQEQCWKRRRMNELPALCIGPGEVTRRGPQMADGQWRKQAWAEPKRQAECGNGSSRVERMDMRSPCWARDSCLVCHPALIFSIRCALPEKTYYQRAIVVVGRYGAGEGGRLHNFWLPGTYWPYAEAAGASLSCQIGGTVLQWDQQGYYKTNR